MIRLVRVVRRKWPRCDTCRHRTPTLTSSMTGPITDQPRRECRTCAWSHT